MTLHYKHQPNIMCKYIYIKMEIDFKLGDIEVES